MFQYISRRRGAEIYYFKIVGAGMLVEFISDEHRIFLAWIEEQSQPVELHYVQNTLYLQG